jgi:hypothetical protein
MDPDPNPDPPDPHDFGHPEFGSGSTSQRYGSGSGSRDAQKHVDPVDPDSDPDSDPEHSSISPTQTVRPLHWQEMVCTTDIITEYPAHPSN